MGTARASGGSRAAQKRGLRRVHSLDFQAGFSGWRDRRLYPLKRVADESGGGREWCRRRWFGRSRAAPAVRYGDGASKRRLASCAGGGLRRVHSLDFQAGFSGWRDRRLYPLKRVADESGGGREWCRRRWSGRSLAAPAVRYGDGASKRRLASCAGGVYGTRLLPPVSSSNTFSTAEL